MLHVHGGGHAGVLVVRLDAEEADADGWLRLEASFQDSRHAEWALWQLGTGAEALAPQSLRTALRHRAEALAALYAASN